MAEQLFGRGKLGSDSSSNSSSSGSSGGSNSGSKVMAGWQLKLQCRSACRLAVLGLAAGKLRCSLSSTPVGCTPLG